jgi:hypothetical protein
MAQINRPNVVMKPSDLYKQATGQALEAYKTMSSVMDMKKQTELQEKQMEWNKRLKAAEAFYNGFVVPGANAHPGKFAGFVREMGPQLSPFLELMGFSQSSAAVFLNKLSQVTPGQEEIMGYAMSNYLVNSQQGESKGMTHVQADNQARKALIDVDPMADLKGLPEGREGKRETGDQGSPGGGTAATQVQPGYRMAVENMQGQTTVPTSSPSGKPIWAYTNIPGQGPASPIQVESGGNVTVPEGVDKGTFRGDLAWYLSGGTREAGHPNRELLGPMRAKIDALNPDPNATQLKVPSWATPEGSQSFEKEAQKVASKPDTPEQTTAATKIKQSVTTLKRSLPVSNTEVGRRATVRNVENVVDNFKVYFSNEVLTPQMIKNAVSHFSETDLRDYVLGIPGQTQKIQAQFDLQANEQAFRKLLFDEELMANMLQFAEKIQLDKDQLQLARDSFEHAKSVDWSKLGLDERAQLLAEQMASIEYIMDTARAKAKVGMEFMTNDGSLKDALGMVDQLLDPLLREGKIPDELKGLASQYLSVLEGIYEVPEGYLWRYYNRKGELVKSGRPESPATATPGEEKSRFLFPGWSGVKRYEPVGPINLDQLRGGGGAQGGGAQQPPGMSEEEKRLRAELGM